MAMPLSLPSYTTEELRAFPHDGCRYELVNGILLVTPQPANTHQVVVGRLMAAICGYLGEHGPAVAVSPGEIELAPSLHLEPDLLVYPARFGPEMDWGAIRDWWLAIEVSGKASRRYDRDYKRDAYLELGVREVWLADLTEKCLLTSRAAAPRDVRSADAFAWYPPEMKEPLRLDVTALFRGVP